MNEKKLPKLKLELVSMNNELFFVDADLGVFCVLNCGENGTNPHLVQLNEPRKE